MFHEMVASVPPVDLPRRQAGVEGYGILQCCGFVFQLGHTSCPKQEMLSGVT